MQIIADKLRAGNYMVRGYLYENEGTFIFNTPYNKQLIEEIKALQGARWNPEEKHWTAPVNERNMFCVKYLIGQDPYKRFLENINKLPEQRSTLETKRDLRSNQIDLINAALSNHLTIWAAEPGLGKSLCFIEVIERLGYTTKDDAWYVGPKAGVVAVNRELAKWASPCKPLMLTYEGFTKLMLNWPGGSAPKLICFDESQKVKSPAAQRSKAALQCARASRQEWGNKSYVILMTGTPVPKDPSDWWQQCEIACPGYLKESHIEKFKRRYALIVQAESLAGSTFPKLVTWWDNPDKCQICGSPKEQHMGFLDTGHNFTPSKNEVLSLATRLKGLVVVQLKKDYSDLPDKMYEVIRLKPTLETIRTAKIINQTEPRAVTKLIKLRELSDGFQYIKEATGTKTCEECSGSKQFMQSTLRDGVELKPLFDESDYEQVMADCPVCGGKGLVETYTRKALSLENNPKLQYFVDDLEAYEEIGRYIVWGGFTETVDLLTQTAREQQWCVLQIDGRGYHGFSPEGDKIPYTELLDAMDRSHPQSNVLRDKYPRVVVVGHPKAGGVALTLTSSPVSLYYSNPFDGEARFQSEDRGHRIGMDAERGFLIKDLIHLPTDQLVLDNLRKKKIFQSITMGEITQALGGL